jgi:hypothetical protein
MSHATQPRPSIAPKSIHTAPTPAHPVPPRTKPDLDALVERICARGCRSVNDLIQRLEQGLPTTDTEGLEPRTVRTLVKELKSIMAVYAARGGVCS